jgi:hypothetical protein
MNKVIDWVKTHPRLSMWVVLAAGMVAIITYEARGVGLLPGQWVALIVATILVAGLCVWIIGWEDDEDQAEVEKTPAAKDAPRVDTPTQEKK